MVNLFPQFIKAINMKKHLTDFVLKPLMVLAFLSFWTPASAQTDKKDKKLVEDSKEGIKDFKHTDADMSKLFSSAYGYVIFPNVGKGAVGVGGASGGGTVFEKGAIVGKAQMTQVTIGFQFGGQAYREIIFFEDKATLDKFKENEIEFSGASASAKYASGIMIFTQQKGGLMYEASVGGQKFKYTKY